MENDETQYLRGMENDTFRDFKGQISQLWKAGDQKSAVEAVAQHCYDRYTLQVAFIYTGLDLKDSFLDDLKDSLKRDSNDQHEYQSHLRTIHNMENGDYQVISNNVTTGDIWDSRPATLNEFMDAVQAVRAGIE